jgi:hypothetical protein
MHGNHRQVAGVVFIKVFSTHRTSTRTIHSEQSTLRMDWTTWWSWRGARTRSHPELGRENPQRPWYCVLRHGRVGRRQVFQSILLPHKTFTTAGWSSPVARQAHNLKVRGSNPLPATIDFLLNRTSVPKAATSSDLAAFCCSPGTRTAVPVPGTPVTVTAKILSSLSLVSGSLPERTQISRLTTSRVNTNTSAPRRGTPPDIASWTLTNGIAVPPDAGYEE